MKGAEQIRSKLNEMLDASIHIEYFNKMQDSIDIMPKTKELLLVALEDIIAKNIKKLNTKSVSKSSIIYSIEKQLFSLLNKDIKLEAVNFLGNVLLKIFEECDPNFFKERLNVKSREFIELPDWNPDVEN